MDPILTEFAMFKHFYGISKISKLFHEIGNLCLRTFGILSMNDGVCSMWWKNFEKLVRISYHLEWKNWRNKILSNGCPISTTTVLLSSRVFRTYLKQLLASAEATNWHICVVSWVIISKTDCNLEITKTTPIWNCANTNRKAEFKMRNDESDKV